MFVHRRWWGPLTTLRKLGRAWMCPAWMCPEMAGESNPGTKVPPTHNHRPDLGLAVSEGACRSFFALASLSFGFCCPFHLRPLGAFVDQATPGGVIQRCWFPGHVVIFKRIQEDLRVSLKRLGWSPLYESACPRTARPNNSCFGMSSSGKPTMWTAYLIWCFIRTT